MGTAALPAGPQKRRCPVSALVRAARWRLADAADVLLLAAGIALGAITVIADSFRDMAKPVVPSRGDIRCGTCGASYHLICPVLRSARLARHRNR